MQVLLENIIVQKEVDTPVATFQLWENNIIYLKFKPGASISMAEVHIARQVIRSFVSNKPFTLLLDTQTDYHIDTDAREFLTTNSMEERRAMAVVVRTFAAKITARLFLKFYKLETPVRVFNDKSQALAWLYSIS